MTYQELRQTLAVRYGDSEAAAVARYLLEMKYGLSLADVACGRTEELDATVLSGDAERLLRGEPVQYVVGEAEFCGRRFLVRPGVLIPRPETEELCRLALERMEKEGGRILDIGTGSGCIAVTMAAERPQAQVAAWDISEDALAVARENARRMGASVQFERRDVLECGVWSVECGVWSVECGVWREECGVWSVIVSNPPYICQREAERMEEHVLAHEPHVALFVPDDDALLFYRAIGRYAQKSLVPGGWLCFEINPLYAHDLETLLQTMGFQNTEIRHDQFGKQRFVLTQKKNA